MKKLFFLFTFCFLFLAAGMAQNWDGKNTLGNFSFPNNWSANALPVWNPEYILNFLVSTNPAQTFMYQDLGWKGVGGIRYASTFNASVPLDGDGSGLEFGTKIENYSSFPQTINIPLSYKGTANAMEFNPVNGDLIFNNVIYNDNNKDILINSPAKMVTFNNYIAGDNSVSLKIYYGAGSKVVIGFSNAAAFSGGVDIYSGELWMKAGATLAGDFRLGDGSGATGGSIYISDSSVATTVPNKIIINPFGVIGGLNTSNTHVFSGEIAINGFGANLKEVNNGGTTAFTGKISGPGNIAKIGLGSIVLAGVVDNTFAGNTSVREGTLVLKMGDGIKGLSTGTTTIDSGATVRTDAANQWGTGTPTLLINNGSLEINGFDQRLAVAGTLKSASISLGTATITSDWALNNFFAGTISGTGNIIKTGAGLWTLTGANTYTGLTSVNNGTLRLNHPGGSTLFPGASVNISGTGTLQVSQQQTLTDLTMSSGTLVVSPGTVLTITGNYNVTGGTIKNSGTIKLAGGAMLFPGEGVTVDNGTPGKMTNLEIAGSGTVTLSAALLLNNLILTSGELDASEADYDLTIGGDWTNNGGAFTPRGNTVTFNGSSARFIKGSASSQTFHNLTVALATSSSTLSFSGNIIALMVEGNLNVIGGN